MENLQPGYYWVKRGNNLLPLLYNGQFWIQHGIEFPTEHFKVVSTATDPTCQTGCVCTKNADGSWSISC